MTASPSDALPPGAKFAVKCEGGNGTQMVRPGDHMNRAGDKASDDGDHNGLDDAGTTPTAKGRNPGMDVHSLMITE